MLIAGPGPGLVNAFGHAALRVSDSLQKLDICFEWVTAAQGISLWQGLAMGQAPFCWRITSFEDFVHDCQAQHQRLTAYPLRLERRQIQYLLDTLAAQVLYSERLLFSATGSTCSQGIARLLQQVEHRFMPGNENLRKTQKVRKIIHDDYHKEWAFSGRVLTSCAINPWLSIRHWPRSATPLGLESSLLNNEHVLAFSPNLILTADRWKAESAFSTSLLLFFSLALGLFCLKADRNWVCVLVITSAIPGFWMLYVHLFSHEYLLRYSPLVALFPPWHGLAPWVGADDLRRYATFYFMLYAPLLYILLLWL
ncbi:MAG: DUF4105 domain-containing protein [Cytophagales bacterium]|nr:DUF4105 domain-containing protein [Cytophagales bacterium]